MVEVFNSAKDMNERGFHMRDAPVAIVNYDPAGDGKDNDAIVLIQREEWRRGELHDPDLAMEFVFRVTLAHRLPVGLEFPEKLATLLRLNSSLAKWKRQKRISTYGIGVEQNGVGYAMGSSLRTKTSAPILGYTTVANTTEKPYTSNKLSMPRLAALDMLRVQMELHRVKVAKDCHGKKELLGELNSFVWAGPGRPEAIVGQKDDLVLALTGAIWLGLKVIPPVTKQVKVSAKDGVRAHADRLRGNIRVN